MPNKNAGIEGQRFGRWLVIRYQKPKKWLCVCDCGTTRLIGISCLRLGKTRSCGCAVAETNRQNSTRHGFYGKYPTRFYRIWQNTLNRCRRKTHSSYPFYGGRGISVCERWKKFEGFRDDLWESYKKHSLLHTEEDTSLDRIDSNGNYEPGNCRWASRKSQSRNRRNNRFITYNGRTMVISDWAKETGLSPVTIRNRYIKYGWSAEKTLTTIPRKHTPEL